MLNFQLILRKNDILKNCQESKFVAEKIWKNALALKRKKVQGIFGETFDLALLSSAVFCLQNCLIFLLICFGQETKCFCQSYLGNEVDFSDIMTIFPNILTKN